MPPKPNRKLLYAFFNGNSGCDRHRLLYPLRYAGSDLPQYDLHLSVTDPHEPFHYYITHGAPTLNNLKYFGGWKRGGGKWIMSLDDDLEGVPDWNHAKLTPEQLDTYRFAFDAADLVLSSTPYLTNVLGRPEKTLTAPNLMVVSDYKIEEPAPITGDPIRILWAGSKTHTCDLEILEKPIDRIIRRWGSQVEFIFIGSAPQQALKNWYGRGVHFESGVPAAVYPQLINKVRPHIALAPLMDCGFNYSKSAIRIYEGWATAAAVIATPIGEYKVIRDQCDGLFATTEDEWTDAIDRLIVDESYRLALAVEGRARVAREFDWENYDCRKPWRDLVIELATRVQ